MKRFLCFLALVPGINYASQKDIQPNQESKQIANIKTTAYMLSSLNIHDMMADRNLAPQIAWMILWGDFKEELDAILRK